MGPSSSQQVWRSADGTDQVRRAAKPVGWPVVAAAVLVAVWITIDVLHFGPWTRLDANTSDVIARWHLHDAPYPRDLVYPLTLFGKRASILVVIGGLVLGITCARRTWQPVLRFVVALGLLAVVIYALKWGVGRTAPTVDTLHTGGASYPSGHVPNALLMWGLAAWLAAEYDVVKWLRRTLNVLRFVGPACAFLGMALLDYHWLSDLVAGVAFGIVLLRLMHLIFDGRLGQLGQSDTTRRSGRPAPVVTSDDAEQPPGSDLGPATRRRPAAR